MDSKKLEELQKKYKKRGQTIKNIQDDEDNIVAVLYDITATKEKQKSYNLTLYDKDDNFASITFLVDKMGNSPKLKYANVVEYIAESSLNRHHNEDESLAMVWDKFLNIARDEKLLAITGEINILDDKLKAYLKDNGFTFYTPNNDSVYYGKHLSQTNYKDYETLMETMFGEEITHDCTF